MGAEVTKLEDRALEHLRRHGSRAEARPVRPEDLEMLRTHRNRPEVRRWLENDAEISPEQQRQWFERGDAMLVNIVELVHENGQREAIGIARLGPGRTVGVDAFTPGQGMGTIVFDLAVRMLRASFGAPLDLWVFLENPGVRLYAAAGFVFDTRADVRWFVRDFGDGPKPRAYVHMVERS